MYSDSNFLFCIEACIQDIAEYEAVISIGRYQFKYSKNTPVMFARCEERELLIYGYAVDVFDGSYEDLAQKILKKSRSVNAILACEERLGGKYLLLYSDATGTYAIPDASASISFCYTTEDSPLMCAFDSEYIAQRMDFKPNAERLKIRTMGDPSQPMPYNITIYKEVEHLLPNHYYSFSQRKAVRFINNKEWKSPLTAAEVAAQTAPMAENILKFYKNIFKLYCPTTSGKDSRTVLSFMYGLDKNIETYTIRHKNFSDTEQDLLIPKEIAKKLSLEHNVIYDTEPTSQMYQDFDDAFGKTGYSRRTLMIANTIKKHYPNSAIMNGNVIDQIGKSSSHRDVPEALATKRYFRCKLHNYSKESLVYLKKWMDEARNSEEHMDLIDLFSVEIQMGRWVELFAVIYAMVGQQNLNIFNSRSIIYRWTRVPRKERKLCAINLGLIGMNCPQLLEVPFQKDESAFVTFSKMNWLNFYIASFIKFHVHKLLFMYKHYRSCKDK